MIAPVNLSMPHVVNSESERTASGGFKCRSCTNIEQKLFVVDSSSGEIICQKCGTILEIENINQNQDWIDFDIGEFNEKARTGAPSSLARHDMGAVTEVTIRNGIQELRKKLKIT